MMRHWDEKYGRPIGVLFDVGDERRVAGQLKLKRGDLFDSNVVSIADDGFVHIPDNGSLHGVSEAGWVSLLECVAGGMLGATLWGEFTMHHGDVSFRYALFGKRHVTAGEKCLRGIEFTLEGVESSVFMQDKFERFGHLRDPDDEILDVIKRKRPDYLKGDFVKGQAMVSYFTGNWEFLPEFETVLGTVHVGRSVQVDMFAQRMEDTPRISIDFDDDPTTLEGAWEKMRKVRQFFAWMMGYAPGWKDVKVFTCELDENGIRADTHGHLEAFGPNEWEELPDSAKKGGTLIDASSNPDQFVEVMTNWLERNDDQRRKNANERFFGCFSGMANRVLQDGIVSAANTFDLLPEDDKPKAEPQAEEVLRILDRASTEIKSAMADGSRKTDVLDELGRIRKKKRLREIVEHRAALVLEHFGRDKLQDLEKFIRLAVQCRNHYTHGGNDPKEGGVDFGNYNVVTFLTRTLEFIYGASELLRCGWDSATSLADERHPIGGYVKDYDRRRSLVPGVN